MLELKSKILQRQFKVYEGNLYASQIRNTLSKMDFIPDGNSVEFLFHFTDSSEFTSKGLQVTDHSFENGTLSFTFAECEGVTVTMKFWAGADGNTLKKQISFVQTGEKTVDYILLENIGIINSKTHFCVPTDIEGTELDGFLSSLGQPIYIDSLFIGCEFPATFNSIVYGVGQVKYYLGKNVEGEYKCPVTVIGGAKDNTMIAVQNAFYDYIDSIAAPTGFRIQYNSWYDHMLNIDADNIEKSFYEIESKLSSNGVPPIDAYVVDDGWNDYRAGFWSFNKKFPNGMSDISKTVGSFGSSFGMWLGPRGGYNFNMKFAKKIEKKGFGAYNAQSKDICIADRDYQKNLCEFLTDATEKFDISYWKLDGFCLAPCTNPKHNHTVGGEENMYYFTEMWQNWIDIFKAVRAKRAEKGKSLWINMTCYINPSPWWLQYVNSIWLQNSNDISFAGEENEMSQLDREITYRDGRYYHSLCTRAWQVPNRYWYNHEPIYGNHAKVDYTDEEFEKYLYFNACRGQALNELYLSYNMMNKTKWRVLSKVLQWQKSNYDILRNAVLIGGNPQEDNVYGYFSWNEKGDGIIALRNPTDEKAPLTLTLNKLMGCPEDLNGVNRYNVYNEGAKENFDSYSYGDKIDLTLKPFEVKVIQFGKTDRRYDYLEAVTDFTISFKYASREENTAICENEDIKISVENGFVKIKCDSAVITSQKKVNDAVHKITVVREKNKLVKLYIDKALEASGYSADAKAELNTELYSNTEEFSVEEKATPYNEIITLKKVLTKKSMRKK